MRTIVTAASTLFMLGGTAIAADLSRPIFQPAPAVMQSWTGFYLGLNAGGAIGQGHSDFSIAGGPAFASINNHLTGAIGGGQIGFNWQAGAAVFGVEADFQASGLEGNLSTPCLPGLCGGAGLTATYSQKVTWFGTARGRIGYAAAGWLLYATGGYAYARLDTDASATATAGPATATFTLRETRSGWTVGTGIEVEFAPRWSAKLEYLYFDFGRDTSSWVLTGLPTITDDAHLTMNVVRGGVNFRF